MEALGALFAAAVADDLGLLLGHLGLTGPLSLMVGRLDIDRIGLAQEFARRSTRGTWTLVPNSDHLIGSQPHAVAAAVLEVVREARERDARARAPWPPKSY